MAERFRPNFNSGLLYAPDEAARADGPALHQEVGVMPDGVIADPTQKSAVDDVEAPDPSNAIRRARIVQGGILGRAIIIGPANT